LTFLQLFGEYPGERGAHSDLNRGVGLAKACERSRQHRERFRTLLPRLYQPFWFDRQREHYPSEDRVFTAPLFVNAAAELRARLALHQIRSGYEMTGDRDAETAAAPDAVATVFRDPTLQFSFMMKPGDMQVAANRELSRTEFTDQADPERRRLLIRLWLRDGGAPGYIG